MIDHPESPDRGRYQSLIERLRHYGVEIILAATLTIVALIAVVASLLE